MSNLADVEICRLQEEVKALHTEIGRLRAAQREWEGGYQDEIERLREALKPFVDVRIVDAALRENARRALEGK